jgi:DNA-binding HxlR family transcriptional regulator
MTRQEQSEGTRKQPKASCYNCPVEAALDVIGGRWKPVIICELLNGTLRFGELRRKVPKVSERMLTQHLKELAEDGIVNRRVFKEVPPRVEYSLTEFGETLRPVMNVVSQWGQQHSGRIEAGAKRRRRTQVRKNAG